MRRNRRALAIVAATATVAVVIAPPPVVAPAPAPARAGLIGSLTGAGCSILGTVGEGWMGKVCSGAGKVLGVVSKVASNPLVRRGAALAAIVAWVLGGARWTVSHIAAAISQTSSPALTAGWFTGVYVRMEAIAWLLTLPFLAAAAAQAVLRSEPGVLARVLGYLPLAALMTGAAVPVTMLLLAVTDALSSGLAHMAGQDGTHFLTGTSAWVLAGLSLADPFVAVTAGIVLVCAGLALWCELVVRELAVYVVVLMLPLVFCAIVWPARRVWAVRTVEVLFALIIAKFAIIVPLAVGAAALAHGGAGSGAGRLIAGLALVLIGCLAPWVLLRLIPLAEVASAAVGHVRGQLHGHAQVPTPEATAAGKVAGHFRRTNRNGTGRDTDVAELLQGMTRRAEKTQPATAAADRPDPDPSPAVPEPGTPLQNRASTRDESNRAGAGQHTSDATDSAGTGPEGQSMSSDARACADASSGGQTPRLQPDRRSDERPPASTMSRAEPETMVQQADGSWQPLRSADPDAPIPPPPWEDHSAPEVEPPTAPGKDRSTMAPPNPDPEQPRGDHQPGDSEGDKR